MDIVGNRHRQSSKRRKHEAFKFNNCRFLCTVCNRVFSQARHGCGEIRRDYLLALLHFDKGGKMKDITFCSSVDCPSKECKIKVLNNKFEDGELISMADFSGTCRFYIGWIANKVKEKT